MGQHWCDLFSRGIHWMIEPGRFRIWHPEQKENMDTAFDLSYSSINDHSIPMDKPLYIAIDPGFHCGWVVATKDLQFFICGETTMPSMPHTLRSLLIRMASEFRMNTTVIIEDFTLTNKPKDTKQAKYVLKQIGAFEHVCEIYGMRKVMQIANVRKLTPTKMLQKHGIWPVGLGHAQSAARHLGAYLITEGILKPV